MPMKRFCVALGLALATMMSSACGPRAASVRTSPTTAESTIHFTNNWATAVNVYVIQNGTETFVKQVSANTTENLPVRGVPLGSSVTLRAVSIDNKSQWDSNPMGLTQTLTWKVP
jgi:ABC-type glycerol-3-phosphate transport system substrate-binding protein